MMKLHHTMASQAEVKGSSLGTIATMAAQLLGGTFDKLDSQNKTIDEQVFIIMRVHFIELRTRCIIYWFMQIGHAHPSIGGRE